MRALNNIKTLLIFMFSVIVLLPLGACSSDDEENEYADWKNRNDAYFANIRNIALDSINQAKLAYGSEWENHCNWKTYLCYSLEDTCVNRAIDSIYVEILKTGIGSQISPYATDSCRVFYRGRLIPTTNHLEGFAFSYSGQSSKYDDIFNRKTAVPYIRKASSFVRGFCTALLHMHVGDRWKVYIPQPLGYGAKAQSDDIPAYSTLIYEIELVAFYRAGVVVPSWN